MKGIIKTGTLCFLCSMILLSCQRKERDIRFRGTLEDVGYPAPADSNAVIVNESIFEEPQLLKGEYIQIEPIIKPSELAALKKGDLLFLKHLEHGEGDPLLHVLQLPSMETVSELAKRGNGPDEFIDIRLVDTNDQDKYCLIYDVSKSNIYYLDKNLRLHLFKENITLKNTIGNGIGNNITHIKDHTFLMQQIADNGMGLFLFNLNDTIHTGIINLNCSSNLNRIWEDDWTCFLGSLSCNAEKTRLVYAYANYHRILFSDIDGKNSKIIQFEEQDPFRSKSALEHMNTGKDTHYYTHIFNSSDYVYLIYRGSNYDDEPNPTYHLEQWTWDGNPVKRYKLEKNMRLTGGFVDEENATIYLFDQNKDDFLYKVKMDLV